MALAESCTGGLVGGRITSVGGSSQVLRAGYVAYSRESKVRDLGVEEVVLTGHGTVSAETAREMARGARERAGTDWGLSVTGVAGSEAVFEEGGEKEPGLVFVGLAGGGSVRAARFRFRGERETVRGRAVAAALAALRSGVLGRDV